jgi:G3E family GTPase
MDSSRHDSRIPVSLLTGFLGSGKTTLLNKWLRDPAMSDAAVIVNEFGEIGIDHSLIASSNDNTIELSTGCLCCTVRGDLVETLRDLRERRSKGDIPRFSRVLIETTGLADPVPVIQALITFPVASAFRLGRVLTVIDAVNGADTIDAHPEALRQVVVADELIISKADLVPADTSALQERVRGLNPGAGLRLSSQSTIPDAQILNGVDIYDPATRPEAVRGWLAAERYDDGGHGSTHDHEHEHGHAQHHHHHDVNRHSEQIGSFSLFFDEPLHWEHVAAWLDALVIAHADDLLRVKGILNIAGQPRPIVVQAVQRLFHPPASLERWPDADSRSRIVFITRGLSKPFVLEVFETLRSRIPVKTLEVAS